MEPKKKPITFKCDPDLLEEVDEWRRRLTYPVTLTSFIESAMRQALDKERGDAKRSARR